MLHTIEYVRVPSTSSQEASVSSCYTPSVANEHNPSPSTSPAFDSSDASSNNLHRASFRRRPSTGKPLIDAGRSEEARPFIRLPGDGDSCEQKPSEVQGMLDFLQDKGKGMTGHRIALEILGIVPLPLSADTFGWLQQNSSADDFIADQGEFSGYRRSIPYRERDDPPDSDISSLP